MARKTLFAPKFASSISSGYSVRHLLASLKN
jgi:hypothetical protein